MDSAKKRECYGKSGDKAMTDHLQLSGSIGNWRGISVRHNICTEEVGWGTSVFGTKWTSRCGRRTSVIRG
jgi:hypothetical protein